ncbi:MAG TPA: hypothetical protein VFU05_02925 [Cyclobacteriaceae bacterium]|nr:hypothetical protein [Cyclobacteriaceae bacterium]
MKDIQEYEKDIASIRTMMERSVKFISLSGLSGVLAGLYALIGAGIAYYIVYYPNPPIGFRLHYVNEQTIVTNLITVAILVLVLSLGTGFWLSSRKAAKLGTTIWNKPSKQLFKDLSIPLVTGGLLIIIMLSRGYFGFVAPACLLFYGLALIYAGRNTFAEVQYLGFIEIGLGLLAAALPGYGLIFWSIGFGVMHIIYGSIMHFRYDK